MAIHLVFFLMNIHNSHFFSIENLICYFSSVLHPFMSIKRIGFFSLSPFSFSEFFFSRWHFSINLYYLGTTGILEYSGHQQMKCQMLTHAHKKKCLKNNHLEESTTTMLSSDSIQTFLFFFYSIPLFLLNYHNGHWDDDNDHHMMMMIWLWRMNGKRKTFFFILFIPESGPISKIDLLL